MIVLDVRLRVVLLILLLHNRNWETVHKIQLSWVQSDSDQITKSFMSEIEGDLRSKPLELYYQSKWGVDGWGNNKCHCRLVYSWDKSWDGLATWRKSAWIWKFKVHRSSYWSQIRILDFLWIILTTQSLIIFLDVKKYN